MNSVRCTTTLLSDKSKKVDIEIGKDKNNKLFWKVIKSAGGNLRLSAVEGIWEISRGEILTLWYETQGKERKNNITSLITLILFDIKTSFFEDIVKNGKTYTAENAGLYNDNPSQKEVSCKLARMN